MFDEINGLPTHALALHAAVVLVPLAAALGVLFAIPAPAPGLGFRCWWSPWVRWPPFMSRR